MSLIHAAGYPCGVQMHAHLTSPASQLASQLSVSLAPLQPLVSSSHILVLILRARSFPATKVHLG